MAFALEWQRRMVETSLMLEEGRVERKSLFLMKLGQKDNF